ncbi:MAG: hypothetical protein EOM91_05205 [Sphingobacteriia bacterium]|nr:hypothetical protein [Sphingobacteriia bacterium]NCC38739.1 hypothetical protein [Gammaproteobacteria bacterium]
MIRSFFPALCGAALAGCALVPPSHVGGIGASIRPMDYAARLCRPVSIEQYPACVSAVLDVFDQPRPNLPPPGHSTSGPFAVILADALYLGEYRSTPFAASFEVSHGTHQCRGAYSALRGSPDAIYDVHCNDGRMGWADVIRASDGRNGIGRFMLDDGTRGDIVFGHLPLAALTRNGD